MKLIHPFFAVTAVLAVAFTVGCSSTPKSPDVSEGIRKSLDAANLKYVSVSEDRDNGVVTLTGKVAGYADKAQAESIAKSMAAGLVVSNQIAVLPPGAESDAKKINSDLDQGIEKNLDAALIAQNMRKGVSYSVKNGVVTLTGEVISQSAREQAQAVAAAVPNVQQVVNELQVKNQKATASN